MREETTTLSMIHAAAMEEFMEKGFRLASLRTIVKNAGVTTGAFYGYYGSKEELFGALVGGAYQYLMKTYKEALQTFSNLPVEKQPDAMGSVSQECMYQMLLYMFDHREEFQLLLQCAEGTRYAFVVDELVELEVEATHQYYRTLQSLGRSVPSIDQRLEHILVTGMFHAYFEMILHEMPLETAKIYLHELNDFYTAGWIKLMGESI